MSYSYVRLTCTEAWAVEVMQLYCLLEVSYLTSFLVDAT